MGCVSFLDIDLDYFNTVDDPVKSLRSLLSWAQRPVDFVVEQHHWVLRRWQARIKRGSVTPPTHILHVDEHHDMMDERKTPNIANFVCHAMHRWPECRVHWLINQPIDSPEMWLSEETWESLAPRFSYGARRPPKWPRPDLVSVCTSPEFVSPALGRQLMEHLVVPHMK